MNINNVHQQQTIIKLITNIPMSLESLPIATLYREVNHITDHGIPGYSVAKKYEDPIELIRSRQYASGKKGLKKHETKRGNYLDDEANLHKIVPGPGKYTQKELWPKKTKSLHHESKKKTYIEQLMDRQRKEKKPAPGQYKIFKSQKQVQAEKKLLASKKITVNDRITYLDHIQYEAILTPGAGSYNPRKRVKTEGSKLKTNPEQWIKKHEAEKKNKKLPKMPDMRTYNPVPASYYIFQSTDKIKNNKNFLGKVERFKTRTEGSGLPPGKYGEIQEWRGKIVKKKQRHGLESISKGIDKSNVYYN